MFYNCSTGDSVLDTNCSFVADNNKMVSGYTMSLDSIQEEDEVLMSYNLLCKEVCDELYGTSNGSPIAHNITKSVTTIPTTPDPSNLTTCSLTSYSSKDPSCSTKTLSHYTSAVPYCMPEPYCVPAKYINKNLIHRALLGEKYISYVDSTCREHRLILLLNDDVSFSDGSMEDGYGAKSSIHAFMPGCYMTIMTNLYKLFAYHAGLNAVTKTRTRKTKTRELSTATLPLSSVTLLGPNESCSSASGEFRKHLLLKAASKKPNFLYIGLVSSVELSSSLYTDISNSMQGELKTLRCNCRLTCKKLKYIDSRY